MIYDNKKLGKKIGVLLLAASTFVSSSICSAGEVDFKFKLVREEETDVASIKVYEPLVNQMKVHIGGLEIDDRGKIFGSFTADKRRTVGVFAFDDEQNVSVKTRNINIKKVARNMNEKKSYIEDVRSCDSRLNNIYLGCCTYNNIYKSVSIDKKGRISKNVSFVESDLKTYANKGKSKKEKLDGIERIYEGVKGNKLIVIVEEYDTKKEEYVISEQTFSFATGKRITSKVIYKGIYSYASLPFEKERYYYTFTRNPETSELETISKYSIKSGKCVWRTDKVDILNDLQIRLNTGALNYTHCVLDGRLYLINGNSIYTVDESADDTEPELVVTIPELQNEDGRISMVGVDDHLVLCLNRDVEDPYITYYVSVKLK